jgi:AcrR family transcriptional regulator
MKPTTTSARLLEAAERHFAEFGYAGTSLRRIMTEAGADSGAIYYHFRTNDALFQAVLRRRLDQLNARRLGLLTALEQAAPPPRVEDVLDAFLRPSFELAARPRSGPRWARLVAWYRVETGEQWSGVAELYGDLPQRFLAALARALPRCEASVLREGLFMVIGLAANYLVDKRSRRVLRVDPPKAPLGPEYRRVLAFCAAGLRALATRPSGRGHG